MTNIPLLWGIQAKPNFVISQFRLYTPLEIKISTGYSVRKRFCSFSFAEQFSLEFYRIQLHTVVWGTTELVSAHQVVINNVQTGVSLGPFPTLLVKLRLSVALRFG